MPQGHPASVSPRLGMTAPGCHPPCLGVTVPRSHRAWVSPRPGLTAPARRRAQVPRARASPRLGLAMHRSRVRRSRRASVRPCFGLAAPRSHTASSCVPRNVRRRGPRGRDRVGRRCAVAVSPAEAASPAMRELLPSEPPESRYGSRSSHGRAGCRRLPAARVPDRSTESVQRNHLVACHPSGCLASERDAGMGSRRSPAADSKDGVLHRYLGGTLGQHVVAHLTAQRRGADRPAAAVDQRWAGRAVRCSPPGPPTRPHLFDVRGDDHRADRSKD
jgi:hypothetical protein